MTFLITVFILFLFFRLLGPYLLRWAVKAFIKKAVRKGTFMHASGPMPGSEPVNPAQANAEGEIKVDYVPQSKPAKDKEFRGGEYVEFEEVK